MILFKVYIVVSVLLLAITLNIASAKSNTRDLWHNDYFFNGFCVSIWWPLLLTLCILSLPGMLFRKYKQKRGLSR